MTDAQLGMLGIAVSTLVLAALAWIVAAGSPCAVVVVVAALVYGAGYACVAGMARLVRWLRTVQPMDADAGRWER